MELMSAGSPLSGLFPAIIDFPIGEEKEKRPERISGLPSGPSGVPLTEGESTPDPLEVKSARGKDSAHPVASARNPVPP